METTINTNTNEETIMRNFAVAMKNLLEPIKGAVRRGKDLDGKATDSYVIHNPIAGYNLRELEESALEMGYDCIIERKTGQPWKRTDKDTGEVVEGKYSHNQIVITKDSTALKNVDDMVADMMEMKMNS